MPDPTCLADRHGTVSAYRHHGCRCPDAKEHNRLYVKRRKSGRPEVRLVDPCGTHRRIRALMALGHSGATISATVGYSRSHATEVLKSTCWLLPGTVATYRRAYDHLSMVPGTSAVTRARAAARGWPTPLAWDDANIDDPDAQPWRPAEWEPVGGPDHAAVARAISGDPSALVYRIDRQAARMALRDAGLDVDTIAARLRENPEATRRTLQRLAAREAA